MNAADPGEYADLGVPNKRDVRQAQGWVEAKRLGADIWTLLSPEQQAMVDRRIAWVQYHSNEQVEP